MRRRGLLAVASLTAASTFLAGCSLFTSLPDKVSTDQRIAGLSTTGLDLQRPVEVRWDSHMVPWITAETDDDAAYTLGYVHAYLRLGQMEIARRLAAGRLSEIGGVLAADIDETIRIIGYYRGTKEAYEQLPPATRAWLDRFTDGINTYIARIDDLPHEYKLFAFEPEPWTVYDVMAFGRLAGSDVNWLTGIGMLALTDRPDWPTIWAQAMEFNGGAVPSVAMGEGAEEQQNAVRLAALLDMIGAHARSGSNAWAVNGERSASGKPILATDPHLGILAPNVWLLAGLKSPSHEVVGMMPAGLPIFGLGRSRHMAWGATNLRARSSDLVDVTALPDTAYTVEKETVQVRFGFDRDIERKVSPYGPLITDSPLVTDAKGRRIALRWIGHLPSDELTAYIAGAQATNIAEFQQAFENYAVPGLAFIVATASGDIAIGTAARLPRRPLETPRDLVTPLPDAGDDPWAAVVDATDLPWIVNPERGFVASANNQTARASVPLTLFDTPPDRITRLNEKLAAAQDVDRDFMAALQRDTYSLSAVFLRDAIVEAALRADMAASVPARLVAWDGQYEIDSKAAVLFEAMQSTMAPMVYAALGESDVFDVIRRWSWFRYKLAADIRRLTPEQIRAILPAASAAASGADAEFATWGEMHRLQLRHPLANAPILGKRYVFADVAAGGSNETVMKSSHNPTAERHATTYGSQARQINDMADMDANWFVLLGGQDGRMNAEGFADQMPLWQRGDYIQIPLSRAAVEETFTTVTILKPKD
ncbi:MAG: penicillin acylase family protein [Minwuia sp.]|nr:penicillin acylase family protein [Minwuia sp.]